MESLTILDTLLTQLSDIWWLFVAAALVGLMRLPAVKGWVGERMVRLTARLRLDPRVYRAFNDVTLPTADGTTQIDHVYVSPYGIFVVETKNRKGWIFGGESQRSWTQKIYRKTRKFQNPLRQNYKHTKALQELLGVDPDVVHSVVVFAGNSRFKTEMPANVVHGGAYVSYIRRFRERVFSNDNVEAICERLSQRRLAPTLQAHREHVRNLANGKEVAQGPPCPKCGASTKLRTARKGDHAGRRFWGCTRFPKCHGAKWPDPEESRSA